MVRKDGQSPSSFIVEGGGGQSRFRDYGFNRKRLALPWPAPPTKAQPALRVAAGCGDPLGPGRPPVPLRERTMGNKIFLPAMSGTMAHSGRAFVG